MKKHLCIFSLTSFIVLTFAGATEADTIMFPYVNENPGNVSTIIAVINGANPCIGGTGANCSGENIRDIPQVFHLMRILEPWVMTPYERNAADV